MYRLFTTRAADSLVVYVVIHGNLRNNLGGRPIYSTVVLTAGYVAFVSFVFSLKMNILIFLIHYNNEFGKKKQFGQMNLTGNPSGRVLLLYTNYRLLLLLLL